MKMYVYQLYTQGRSAAVIDKSYELARSQAHAKDIHGNWKNSSVIRFCKIKKQKHGRILALEKSQPTS